MRGPKDTEIEACHFRNNHSHIHTHKRHLKKNGTEHAHESQRKHTNGGVGWWQDLRTTTTWRPNVRIGFPGCGMDEGGNRWVSEGLDWVGE